MVLNRLKMSFMEIGLIREVIDIFHKDGLRSFAIMARKKTIKEPRALTVVVSKSFHSHLERVVLRLSNQKGKVLNLSEVVRSLLEEAFPMPTTMDMFEKE